MPRLLPLFIIAFTLAEVNAPAQQELISSESGLSFSRLRTTALHLGERAGFDPALPSSPPDTELLSGCPKFKSFQLADAYPEAVSGLRDVSETSPDVLPLPVEDMDRASLLAALGNTLAYWKKKPDTFQVLIGKDHYPAAQMRKTTQKLIELFSAGMTPEELRAALKTQFRVYRSVADDGSGKVVITGYYAAEIKASRRPDAVNRFPVYLKPADLIKTTPDMGADFDYGRVDANGDLVRHYSRQEISNGILEGKGLELVWTEHPAWILLLQIQGSGILRFADGDFVKVGFDGANGWPFKSVQKILVDCGEIPPMPSKDFINYLTTQGERESRLVDLNPRYIFFATQPKNSPVYGAIGMGLTPGRSIAVDPVPIPLGATGLLSSRRPVAGADGSLSFSPFTRFVTAQDTGSAIRGPGRIDLYWGSGETAYTEASSMKAPGDLFILVAK